MHPVLFIAYHYPPIRAGSERANRLVQHLPEFGYDPVVLTTSAFGDGAGAIRAWEPVGLYRALFNPERRGVADVRTGGGLTRALVGWLRAHLLLPDAQIGWLPHAALSALRCIELKGVRLLFSTFPPASSHLLALGLKRLTGLPWVADFRDTWTYDPLDPALDRGGVRLGVERALEARVVQRADRITVVTEVARQDFLRRFPIHAGKIALIPNGYEPAEAERVEVPPRRRRMRMVHTGTFSQSHPKRSPAPLFQALRGMSDAPELVLLGALTQDEMRMATDLVERGVVRIAGPVSREEARYHQSAADLLILVDHPRPGRASNIPSKFYEYLATGRPILALAPDGATRDLLTTLGAGRCADPGATEMIRECIDAFTEEWKRTGRLRSGIALESLARFQWTRLAELLAWTFNGLISQERERR